MGNERSRFVEEPTYYPQLSDKQAEEMRGTLGRGLGQEKILVEAFESIFDADKGEVIGCGSELPDAIQNLALHLDALKKKQETDKLSEKEVFDQLGLAQIEAFAKVAKSTVIFNNRTACLLRVAQMSELLAKDELYNRSPDTFFSVVGLIVSVSDTLIKRTRERYRYIGTWGEFEPLDKAVLNLSPIKDFPSWKNLYDKRKDVIAGRSLVLTPISLEQPKDSFEDSQEWQQAMDAVDAKVEDERIKQSMMQAATGDMPEVRKHIQNLKEIRFRDIEAQTRARYSPIVRDDTVYEHVDLIMYHSVFSFMLDKKGNPAFLHGFPYSILMPDPGIPMQRRMQSQGLWLSTGTLADFQLSVKRKTIKSILFGGVGGLIEPGMGFSWEHELHTRLQRYINFSGFHAVPIIVVDEAFSSAEFTLRKAASSFDDIIERTGKYLFAEVVSRLEKLYENYEEILIDLTKQVVEGIIVEQVKKWAREYIVKKIGKKLVPGLNLLSIAQDLADKEEIARTRAAIACVMMSVKSSRPDDLTISSKVLSKIGIDKVQEAAIEEIQKAAGKRLIKRAESAIKSKSKPDPDPKTQPTEPAKSQEPAQSRPESSAKQPQTKLDPRQIKTQNAANNRNTPSRADLEQARRTYDEIRKAQDRHSNRTTTKTPQVNADAHRGIPPDSRKTRDQANDSRALGSTSAADRGLPKKRKNPQEPPLPPTHASAKDKLEFYKKNKDSYPKDIGDKIDAEIAKAKTRKKIGLGKKGAENVNKVIEAENKKNGTNVDRIPDNLTSEQRIEYLKRNRDGYPAEIRKKVDEEIERIENLNKDAGKTKIEEIESAIKDDYRRVMEIDLGIPIDKVKRREVYSSGEKKGEDKPGTDTEKTNVAERTGSRSQVSAVSRTADGEQVELDDVFVDDKGKLVAREYKSSLEIKQKSEELSQHDIEQRMEKQSRWADDYDARYEWVYHSKEDAEKMYKAKANLLKKAGDSEKLKRQYKRIEIVPYPYDE